MSFCCPRCRGLLSEEPSELQCQNCSSIYRMRLGFVDFRVRTASDIDADQDLRLAEALAERELHTSLGPTIIRCTPERPPSSMTGMRHTFMAKRSEPRAP